MSIGERRVVVTGLGCICPIGNTVQEVHKSLLESKSGVSKITQFDAQGFASQIAGEVKNFEVSQDLVSPKESRRLSRFIQFAVQASWEALKDSNLNLEKEDPQRIGVLIGSGIGSLKWIEEQHKILLSRGPSKVSPFLIPMLIVNEASGYVSMKFGLKGPNLCITTACASGSHALGEAYRIIKYGSADIMIAGGTESCITPLGVAGFSSMKALSCRNQEPQKASRPFDKERDGFVMAEGCGIAILEEYEHAKKRGAYIYAELAGYGATSDAYHITAPDPEGEGARKCMELALKDARINCEEVDYINAHGTSTPLNDKVETLAIKKVFKEHSKKIAVSSTKSMTGHTLGAAGGVEFVVCCLSIKHKFLPPTINYEYPDPECDLDYVPNTPRSKEIKVCLSNSLGFGGHNATLVLRKI